MERGGQRYGVSKVQGTKSPGQGVGHEAKGVGVILML
jgi:hypothetical protein